MNSYGFVAVVRYFPYDMVQFALDTSRTFLRRVLEAHDLHSESGLAAVNAVLVKDYGAGSFVSASLNYLMPGGSLFRVSSGGVSLFFAYSSGQLVEFEQVVMYEQPGKFRGV